MNKYDIFEISAVILSSLAGGALIILGFSSWMGRVIANRILERERAIHRQEQELLIPRRDVYVKLATSMRVFLQEHQVHLPKMHSTFLLAYDEAALWAPDSVMNVLGEFLDLVHQHTSNKQSISPEILISSYRNCINAMRKEAGFPDTDFFYRVVNF